jgi:hypothetical protein
MERTELEPGLGTSPPREEAIRARDSLKEERAARAPKRQGDGHGDLLGRRKTIFLRREISCFSGLKVSGAGSWSGCYRATAAARHLRFFLAARCEHLLRCLMSLMSQLCA